MHVDQPDLLAEPAHVLDDDRGVGDGVGVGHREDGGVAAERGGGRARGDGLRLLAAGLAQVGVQVDEAGQQHEAVGVEGLARRSDPASPARSRRPPRRAPGRRPGRPRRRAGRRGSAGRRSSGSSVGPSAGLQQVALLQSHCSKATLLQSRRHATPSRSCRRSRQQVVEDGHPHVHPVLHLRQHRARRRVRHRRRDLHAAHHRPRVQHHGVVGQQRRRAARTARSAPRTPATTGRTRRASARPAPAASSPRPGPAARRPGRRPPGTARPSTPTGSSVGGATSTTSAPSVASRKTFERATRLCSTSPTIPIRRPATTPSRSRRVAASSSAWVGCSWVPSPALTTLVAVPGPVGPTAPAAASRSAQCAIRCAAPEAGWRTTMQSAPIAASVARGVAQRLALAHRRPARRHVDRVGAHPLAGDLEGDAGAGGVLVEHRDDGAPAQRGQLAHLAAQQRLLEPVRGVEQRRSRRRRRGRSPRAGASRVRPSGSHLAAHGLAQRDAVAAVGLGEQHDDRSPRAVGTFLPT